MRHATEATFARIDGLLTRLRSVPGLVERTRGVFYLRSRAFLHFHEDGDDVYADVRLDGDGFERMRVMTRTEQARLLRDVRTHCASV